MRHIHVVTGCQAELLALELAALGNPDDCFGEVPPHPVLLPEGRRDACTSRCGNSGVLSPLGERDRVRGGFIPDRYYACTQREVCRRNVHERAGGGCLPAGRDRRFPALAGGRAADPRLHGPPCAGQGGYDAHAHRTPIFGGERGHPPFIGRALFGEILESDGEGGLRAILARHEHEAASVAVFDRGCLMDMDCPDDYRRLLAALPHHHVPDADECEAMLEVASAPEPVRRHCRAVAALATHLARQLKEAGERLDVDLVQAAALVHDIAKGRPDHAEAGAALVREFGFPAVADVAARHQTIEFDGNNRRKRRGLPCRQACSGRDTGLTGNAFRSGIYALCQRAGALAGAGSDTPMRKRS